MVFKTGIIEGAPESPRVRHKMVSVGRAMLLLLIIFSVGGCGKRTPPKPQAGPDESSPIIKLEKTRFRADDLVIDWRLDFPAGRTAEHDISAFRIYILPEPAGCRLCRKKLISQIDFPLAGAAKSANTPRSEPQPRLMSTLNKYQALIPARFFKRRLLKKRLFLGADYIDKSGKSSPVLQKHFPPYPLKIPVPLVSVSVGEKRCRPPTLNASGSDGRREPLLKLKWTLRQEGAARALSENGSWSGRIYHYKLNLYKSRENSKGKIQYPINREPLSGSVFSLADFHGSLYARHVDRFGNESEEVPIFDGVCR